MKHANTSNLYIELLKSKNLVKMVLFEGVKYGGRFIINDQSFIKIKPLKAKPTVFNAINLMTGETYYFKPAQIVYMYDTFPI